MNYIFGKVILPPWRRIVRTWFK